jgi:hypothetical protein
MINPLLNVIDPFGHFIQLTETCYTNHILVEHPDLSDVEEIARTLETPDFITQDVIDPKRLVYYRI